MVLQQFNPYKLGVLFWDIGKPNSQRWDATERRYVAILFAYRNLAEKWNKHEIYSKRP